MLSVTARVNVDKNALKKLDGGCNTGHDALIILHPVVEISHEMNGGRNHKILSQEKCKE